ncbi:flagellar biosynthesis protein FlhA [Paracraurococcus ruber]|uniref:Flagellar biosynthesis protein FlhA n=1 Tax=Paracraurococcus ruber TaxID=77675 RepID=A0ABS1D296_9PROT|nr:flagellar biosynthesis protein FlhA [Paracraurococcus ruber]MBK1660034.1 flagellar biosynthesis protein FlhA [Paracraurococcus ruber]TDG28621.1 flagellar biosynthesis protein FlhA [Paracraurococcus ruber]
MGILDRLKRGLGHQDLLFAAALVVLLAVLVLPMPTWLVDIGLATSITLSVLILMVAIWIDRPLDFSAFPTVLLMATMLRLALNLATTRLILANGHQGLEAAGGVIHGFASFVVGGDFIIGVIVFAILIVVNFVVVTKGATRIAEVAARFSLDAMPGKQMAIDADLAAGTIDDKEARRRRRELEDESGFYGAMDGASKFVRGDAVAAIIITGVNVLGGIVIGTLRHNLPLSTAASHYVTLSIGDGIVSQIPGLIVSIGAGMLVTKGNLRGSADKALVGQLGAQPKPLYLAAALAGLFALLPGLPFMPFIVLGALAAGGGWLAHRSAQRAAQAAAEPAAGAGAAAAEESINDLIRVDEVCLELGMGLVPLTAGRQGGIADRVKKLRRSFGLEFGFVLPAVRIKDNLNLASGEYSVQVQGVEVARETMMLGRLLAFSPGGQEIGIPGIDTLEPAFRIRARWIDAEHREAAMRAGLTVVDLETVVTTHLAELLKTHMAALQGYAATQRLLDGLAQEHQRLAADLVPGLLPLSSVQKVLATLLAERVSIRNLPLILEALHEAASFTRSVPQLAEHVRQRLAMQICRGLAQEDGNVTALVLSPEWEREVSEAIIEEGDQRSFVLAPSRVQELVGNMRSRIGEATARGDWPAILTSAPARPFIRQLVERINPTIAVISHAELHQRTRLRTVGQI